MTAEATATAVDVNTLMKDDYMSSILKFASLVDPTI